MSFKMLKDEIIDLGLCQGCGLCAGYCKHIELVDLKPQLKDYCIVEKEGLACGKCYNSCPQVRHLKIENKTPVEILSLQTTDEQIRKNAASGGFITTLNKYLLETKQISHLIEVQNVEDRPQAVVTTNPNETKKYSGVAYGRSGVLKKLIEVLGTNYDNIGVVGVPCEIRGAYFTEQSMKKEFFKIGLFCNANIRNKATDGGEICSPCCNGCPAGVNAAGYINLIRKGKYQEAVNLIRETNPLPSICGRICTHECEYGCTLIGTSKPIAIRELKKFVTEWEMKHGSRPSLNINGKKVAIIGSGPAGLTAAYYLANMGYKPTIFEKSDQIGGMLRFGVPKFRLPDEILDYDIETVKQMGVEIKTNTPLGPKLTFSDLKNQGYEAIFVAIGQYKPKTLKTEGEDLPNIHVAIDFLMKRKYRYWENQEEFKGKTIGILGAGPVAVDVAQTALRLGANSVTMVDIASEKQLELARKDIPENELKHIKFLYEHSTAKFALNEKNKLEFHVYKINTVKDESGKIRFEKIPGSESKFEVDTIIIAIGQEVDYALLDAAGGDKLLRERGKIIIDEITFETSVPGIFAGGDIVTRGKNVAIAAIAHGRAAAISIDRYLKGQDLKEGRKKREQSFFTTPLNAPKDYSQKPPIEQASENLWLNFQEIDGIFNEDLAVKEAKRCLNCNNFCAHCQDFAGVYADLTAGEIGSEKGFTTVVIWTKKGQNIVKEMLEKGLLTQGAVSTEAVDIAIKNKMKRELIEHHKTPREKILNSIKYDGPDTIIGLSKKLNLDLKTTRYNALRLAQEKKIGMKIVEGSDEPIFNMEIEE